MVGPLNKQLQNYVHARKWSKHWETVIREVIGPIKEKTQAYNTDFQVNVNALLKHLFFSAQPENHNLHSAYH